MNTDRQLGTDRTGGQYEQASVDARSGGESKRSLKSGQRDYNSIYSELQSEKPPELINGGPFHVFAIIDGHRGSAVAEFVRNHLMDVILRNENIMVRRYFSIGLK